MQLASIKLSVFAALLMSASCTLTAQQSLSASDCKRSVDKSKFEDQTIGPFVTDVGYSRALKACVVVLGQWLDGPRHRVQALTYIVNAADRSTVWKDERLVHFSHHLDNRYSALNEELKKLDIELAPR
jgi:hypothetical protein